jgi:DNA-directed RNA polymerase subunit beta
MSFYLLKYTIPDFIHVQRESFLNFLQKGLVSELEKRNPIVNSTNDIELCFYPKYYKMSPPESSPKQAILKHKTYASRLYVPVQLINKKTKKFQLQWMLLGNLPLMTKRGHFIINGSPRVIIHQMLRSPGIYYKKVINKKLETIIEQYQERKYYADLISYRGAWLRLEIDKNSKIWARMKKTPKISILVFLQSIGLSLTTIYKSITHPKILKESFLRKKEKNVDTESDEQEEDDDDEQSIDHPTNQDEALLKLYSITHPKKSVNEINLNVGKNYIFRKFFNIRTYDLGLTGRINLNKKLGMSVSVSQTTLTSQDILFACNYLINLKYNIGNIDDIDHLKNRRVRTSGELIQNQLTTGFIRLEKIIREKLNEPSKKLSIRNLINTKAINGALREFFGTSPLSQFMDQTNPLSEITHKRRLSSLGPGGVNRETAGMPIRGIHPTHYGRICPIETPEGQNAGLVNSITTHAKLNQQGFLETPFYKIFQGQVLKDLGPFFLTAEQEEKVSVAPSDIFLNTLGFLPKHIIPSRKFIDFMKVFRNNVDFIAISPIQMISIATSLIPFLEHDDANRALMGSNMQRQAVPLILPTKPIVGTGLEPRVCSDSGSTLQAKSSGFVSYVSGSKIIVYNNIKRQLKFLKNQFLGSSEIAITQKFAKQTILKKLLNFSQLKEFKLVKPQIFYESKTQIQNITQYFTIQKNFMKKNNWWPLQKSQLVEKRKLFLAKQKNLIWPLSTHGSSLWTSFTNTKEISGITNQELVLPYQNSKQLNFLNNFFSSTNVTSVKTLVLTDYMENIITYNHFNTINFQKHQRFFSWMLCMKDPKQFSLKEKDTLTCSLILNKAKYKLFSSQKNLDQLSLKKKKKTKLKPTEYHLNIFQRSNQDTCISHKPAVQQGEWVQMGDLLADNTTSVKGELTLGQNILIAYMPWEGFNFEDAILISERLNFDDQYTSIHIERYECKISETKFGLEEITNKIPDESPNNLSHLDTKGIAKVGTLLTEGDIIVGKIAPILQKILRPHEKLLYDIFKKEAPTARDTSLRVPKGVEGTVISVEVLENAFFTNSINSLGPARVYVFLAEKRKIQVGDKMSGRHGNKGIVSRILPRQDMPYLPDGTPIDMVLNPLGVPSRMNVGQIFECLLGLAGKHLNQSFKIMPFDEIYGPEASRSLVYSKLYEAKLKTGQDWLFDPNFPGKMRLFDGRTGESFDQAITVGQAYILKLVHLVDDKIHARSTGPYALVTQQPLRGKSKHGGQRLGEMEVWALEGFGAAYILQELLTVKSDDIKGRHKIMETILRNKPFSFGTPESFKVLIRELQSLCLDIGVFSMNQSTGKKTPIDFMVLN